MNVKIDVLNCNVMSIPMMITSLRFSLNKVARSNQSQSAAAASGQEAEVYNNIDRILATNKSVLAKTGAATGHQMATPPSNMQRRYSNESLVSNPAMLHTGAIVHAEDIASSVNPTDSFIKPSQVTLFPSK